MNVIARIDWTNEQIEQLTALRASGLSASRIGELMGLTRNTIIGKASRLGLPVPKPEPTEAETEKDRARKRAKAERERARRLREQVGAGRTPRPARPSITPIEYLGSLNIPMMSLESFRSLDTNQCRFMAANEPAPYYICCGVETEPGMSFCPHHHAVTHQVWERRT